MNLRGLFAILALLPARQDESPPAPEPSPYAKSLAAATAALEAHDLDAAQRALDSAVLEQHDFGWEHLRLAVELARCASAGPGMNAPAGLSQARMHKEPAAVLVGPVSTMHGQTTSGRAVAISPAGDRIAASGLDDEVRIWRARTGDIERILMGHGGPITSLAFSPDGARVVSASQDGAARVWVVADGSCTLTLQAGAGALSAVAWSPDGKSIATADASLAVRVWDPFQTQPRLAVRRHAQPIHAIAFSPDSKQVASVSEDGSVCVADVASGDVVRQVQLGKGASTACCFDPRGGRLLVGRQDWTVRVLDASTGDVLSTLRQKRGTIESIAFTPDGRRFAVGTTRGSLQLWDADSGEQVLLLQDTGPAIHCVTFDARGSRLLVGADDHAVRVYETEAAVARAVQRGLAGELPEVEAAAEMKPMEIEALCRRVVQHAGLDPALYERAEELSKAALDRVKESGQLKTTYAAAIYRRDRSEEALALLVEAADKKRGWPPNLAFRVMALAKLGRIDEAKTWMQKLETLMAEERWKSDGDARALAEEARAVFTAAKSAR
jgi:hypothetical protein